MPAFVMKVTEVKKHPNADSLFVYVMQSIANFKYQIVANSTNIYQVGDLAIVAMVGSKLNDADKTYIEESSIRGVMSSGMALGPTDLPIGTDVTTQYCLPIFHVKWPDIESLFNVRKNLIEPKAINYVAKIKLDGTNAAIQINPDGIVVQGRTTILTVADDNYGFARWVENNKDYFEPIAINADQPLILFGEWCGLGIQKRCSISKVDRKIFCVFAIQYGDQFDINPVTIRKVLPEHKDIFVLPFYRTITVNYGDVVELQSQVEILNQWVKEVEKCDPFVRSVFNIEGLGEGLVFYPVDQCSPTVENVMEYTGQILVNRAVYKELVFKAKGEEHAVVKTKQPVQIDPEVAKTIDEFATIFVTENRLDQFAQKIGDFDLKNTGKFLKLFLEDVVKESTAELEVANMTWKDVNGAVSNKARTWWMDKCKVLN